ncbi:MAG: hypothetical protein JF593_10210 [Novosphingobium sp.]|nr:hypothetical protein [Novosphingobium sp.]
MAAENVGERHWTMVKIALAKPAMRRVPIRKREAARHPFRVALPAGRGLGIGVQEIKEFLLAYCACFIAVSAFIA